MLIQLTIVTEKVNNLERIDNSTNIFLKYLLIIKFIFKLANKLIIETNSIETDIM